MRLRHHLLVLLIFGLPMRGADEWRRLSSDHFDLYTDAPTEPAERILRQVENFRAAFLATPLPSRFRHPGRVRIVLYRHTRDFHETLSAETAGRIGGYARPETAVPLLVLALSQNVADQVTPTDSHTMYHELVHALTLGACVGRALWFDEGTAEYFANCRLRDDAVLQGAFSSIDVQALRDGRPMPLQKLLDPKTRWDETNVYPSAWLFAHYCFHGGGADLRERYFEFGRRAVEGEPTDEAAFRSVFGCSTADMDERLKRYISAGTFRPTLIQFDAANSRTQIRWQKLSPADRDIALASVNFQSANRKLRRTTEDVINRYPDSNEILALQALRAVARNDGQEARRWIDTLAHRTPEEAQLQAYAARMTLLVVIENHKTASAEDFTKIAAYAHRALELEPQCDVAQAVLEYVRRHSVVIRAPPS